MPLVSSHFKQRFIERNPIGRFNHFYGQMINDQLVLLKSIVLGEHTHYYYEYNCPVSFKSFVALRKNDSIWMTFMFKERFIEQQAYSVNRFNGNGRVGNKHGRDRRDSNRKNKNA